MSISLLRFSGSQIKPKDDSILFETFAPCKQGIMYGVDITSLGSDQVNITGGRGIYRGRDFVIEQEVLHVQLASSGTMSGRIYIHFNLGDSEKPIEIKSVCANSLPEIEDDDDFNIDTTEGDMVLATYTASETQVTAITKAYSSVEKTLDILDDLKKSVSDGKSSVASAITSKGVTTASDATFAQMATNINAIKLGTGNVKSSEVLAGKTYSSDEGTGKTGTMPNKGAWTGATTGSGNVSIPAGYHNGSGYVSGSGAYNAGVSATKVGTASAGDVLSGKTFTNASSVGASGSMANKGGTTVDASAVTSDSNYTYLTVPTAGYYNTNSKVRTLNSNLGANEILTSEAKLIYSKKNTYTYSFTQSCKKAIVVCTSASTGANPTFSNTVSSGIITNLSQKTAPNVRSDVYLVENINVNDTFTSVLTTDSQTWYTYEIIKIA